MVERNWNGPARVLGGAGTGKTVVAMHRAKWLASQLDVSSNKNILFTTFTKNLAADINVHLGQICTKAELEKIEVINIDAWVSKFIRRHDYKYQVVSKDSKFRSFKIAKFQRSKVSKFQSFKLSRFKVSKFQIINILTFSNVKDS